MNETNKQENPLNYAIEKVQSGGWIYFTKSSYGDIYKVRPDGTELTLLYYGKCDGLKIKGGELHFTEYLDNDCYEGYTVDYIEKRCSIPLDETEMM